MRLGDFIEISAGVSMAARWRMAVAPRPPPRTFAACWESYLRSGGNETTHPSRLDGDCSCPEPPPVHACDVEGGASAAAWPAAQPEAERLVVAVAAHVRSNEGRVLLLRCLCSILTFHPTARILLTDNGSPAGSAPAATISRLGGRYGAGYVVVCRRNTSGWSFGALGWATEAAKVLGASHFAYLQQTMRLQRRLPLESLASRNCSLMNFQWIPPNNYHTEERLKVWVLRKWVTRAVNQLGLDAGAMLRSAGIYSHAFMAEASAVHRLAASGLWRRPLCSKFQDQGAERLLGIASDQLLSEHLPQSRCSVDGPLFKRVPNATVAASAGASAAYFAATGEAGRAVMQKISHIKPENSASLRSDDRTLYIRTLGRSFWRQTTADLSATCGASLEHLRSSVPRPPSAAADLSSAATPPNTHLATPSAGVPLRAAYVCISAHSPSGSGSSSGGSSGGGVDALGAVVGAALAWHLPTVHLAVITYDVSATKAYLRHRGLLRPTTSWEDAPRAVRVLEPAGSVGPLNMNRRGPSLTWFHRKVWAAAYANRHVRYDVFVYLEHDMLLGWDALSSWARDEAILATAPLPRGATVPYKRGFYRWYVRYRRPSGTASAAAEPAAAAEEAAAADVEAAGRRAERFMADGNPCLPIRRLLRCRVRVGNATFVGLPNPYSASSVLTRERLRVLLASDQWLPNKHGNLFTPRGRVLLGPRETAASGDAYLGFTEGSEASRLTGCASAMLVPYSVAPSGELRLARDAGLRHIVQRYPFGLRVADCLVPRSAARAGDNAAQLAARLLINFSGVPCAGCRRIDEVQGARSL